MSESRLKLNPDYLLGHARSELERLIEQARFYGDLTAQVFQLAGIAEGMRVLDIGCGAGDVSFLAASMVGPSGTVIGVDGSQKAVTTARSRAEAAGLSNVRFQVGHIDELVLDEPVDALVGRFVLMYAPDPAATLRNLLRSVRSGGIVALQEMDGSGSKSKPHLDVYTQTGRRIGLAFKQSGVSLTLGLRFPRLFRDAGLPEPQMLQMARVETGADSPAYNYMVEMSRTLLPAMERLGIATAEDVALDTLAERMRAEVVEKNAVMVLPPLIGAWARTP